MTTLGACVTDYEHLEKLLDSKLDGFITLLRLELSNIKSEVKETSKELSDHKDASNELVGTFRDSVVRVHARIDAVEGALKNPKKPSVMDIIRTKSIEWAVPMTMLFIIYLLTSGVAINFLKGITTK